MYKTLKTTIICNLLNHKCSELKPFRCTDCSTSTTCTCLKYFVFKCQYQKLTSCGTLYSMYPCTRCVCVKNATFLFYHWGVSLIQQCMIQAKHPITKLMQLNQVSCRGVGGGGGWVGHEGIMPPPPQKKNVTYNFPPPPHTHTHKNKTKKIFLQYYSKCGNDWKHSQVNPLHCRYMWLHWALKKWLLTSFSIHSIFYTPPPPIWNSGAANGSNIEQDHVHVHSFASTCMCSCCRPTYLLHIPVLKIHIVLRGLHNVAIKKKLHTLYM